MNALLAKPIPAIWFMRARTVDLHQPDAAVLFVGLPSWLRDHPLTPGCKRKCCAAQLENFNARRGIGFQPARSRAMAMTQLSNSVTVNSTIASSANSAAESPSAAADSAVRHHREIRGCRDFMRAFGRSPSRIGR
ncbi:hypothetical protein [Bradyrhizobium roseum]|uniref:hypothetical protein n=1 Tax=Bradyrhizobium roseum TaxID=3056648 RepID=UPI002629FF95|nr:hypothetical protein [Bradyrhizobium roseus]WKA28251.1 hypothetical protein QUH67_32700 [Bradyrhizobium roseus]